MSRQPLPAYIQYKSRLNKVQEKQEPPKPTITPDIIHEFLDNVIEYSKLWNVEHETMDLVVRSDIELKFLQKLRELIDRQQNDVLGAYLKSLETKLKK